MIPATNAEDTYAQDFMEYGALLLPILKAFIQCTC